MFKLHPHQAEAVEKLDSGKILCGDVGTGKSLTAVAYYMKKEAPLDVIVITTAKKRDSLDWEREFARYGIGKERDATVGGVLTVDSWNNIGRYRDRVGSFFIFDEQRLVGSGEWAARFLAIARRNRWILLTATPGDTWLDYIPVFVANGFYKNRTAFKREHVVYNTFSKFAKVDRYIGLVKLTRLRNQLLVEMPYLRHTRRHVVVLGADHDKLQFERVTKDRWNVFEARPLRDVAELFSVMRKVVNSSPSRLDLIRDLMSKHPRLIVFYNFDYELELLRSLAEDGGQNISKNSKTKFESSAEPMSKISLEGSSMTGSGSSWSDSTPVQFAEWNGHKHEPIPSGDRWVYLVQYVAGAEGWNCIETNAMVFYSLTYSYKIFHQAHGRIDRLDTLFIDLYYYILMSDSLIDRLVWKALREKRSFNEKRHTGGKV